MHETLDRLVSEMFDKGIRYEDARRELERRFIMRALSSAGGSLCDAAARLGMHRNTLSRKIAEHKLGRFARSARAGNA